MRTIESICEWILRRPYPAILVALGLVMALPSLRVGLLLDDYSIRAAVLRSELAVGVLGSSLDAFTFVIHHSQAKLG